MNRGHAQSGGRHAFASALRVAGEEGDTAYRSAEVAGWRWGLERVPYPRRSLWERPDDTGHRFPAFSGDGPFFASGGY